MQFLRLNKLKIIYSIILSSLILALLFTTSNAMKENLKELRVGFYLYSPPVVFEEYNDFNVQGISIDIAKMVAENMGCNINLNIMDNLDYTEALEKGRVDLIIGIKDDFENLINLNLIETDILVDRHFFVNSKCGTFNALEDLHGHTVILRSANFATQLLTSRSDISYIVSNSEEESLALLDSGKAQVLISHSRILDMDAIKNRGYHNIKEVGKPIKSAALVIATHQNNPELYDSLSKAYEKATVSTQYNKILNFWMNRDVQFVNTTKRNIMVFINALYRYIIIVIGIVIFSFLGIIFWNNMLKRKVNDVKNDLYQSEQNYKDLIETSPDMIHLVFPDGKIKSSNKIALNCLGYNENEISSISLHDLVSSEEVEKVTVFLDRVFKDHYFKSEFTLLAKDGMSINVEMVATIVKWGSRGDRLACTFSRDLTERKRLEENLINSDRLAIMGRIAAGIAHEINNPLGIILTNIGVLTNSKITREDFLESVKSIERSALRAGKIIEDLLNFTRPSLLDKASFDLISIIDESLLFLKQKMKNKDIRVEKQYSEKPLIFRGNEKMIQQLLINLILNAIHAVRNKGNITLAARRISNSGENMITIEVEDDGVGIPSDDILKICNPFYTSRKEGGFGLGLFICKTIVEKHNGNIFFNSDLHKGTVVTVKLPLGGE